MRGILREYLTFLSNRKGLRRIWPILVLVLIASGCTPRSKAHTKLVQLNLGAQRQLILTLNQARRPEDLVQLDPNRISIQTARQILEWRDAAGALGFRGIDEIRFDPAVLDAFAEQFGSARIGRWDLLPYNLQRPDGSLFGAAHAAMLHNGWVLFLPRSDSTETLLWNPAHQSTPVFEFPADQPDERLFCSGHTFLADGTLLTVGGGGNSASGAIASGWKFNPASRKWSKATDSMSSRRWYPTAVTLGDGRVFVASGLGADSTEVYDPASDAFSPLTGPAGNPSGANRLFPETYPGLHLLPGGEILFARTGWGHGRNDSTVYAEVFRFSGTNSGEWVELISPMNSPDRTEGMSVILLHDYGRRAEVMVIGGGDPSATGRGSAETLDVAATPPAWKGHPSFLPDSRFNVNAVLLPDGNVLAVGGRGHQDWPALLYSPQSGHWSEMAQANYRREYHSVALLLPDGKVMTTGGDYGNTQQQRTSIEIFSPPYLFRGSRPEISSAPEIVSYGEVFDVQTPQASAIDRVVLVRPMAVTHHTDSEQRVVQLEHDPGGYGLKVRAPNGSNARNLAPPGYYMLFVLADGVPSIAKFVRLSCPDPAAVEIDFNIVARTDRFRGRVAINGRIKNLGARFDSGAGQQTLILYEVPLGGQAKEIARKGFVDLAPEQELDISYQRIWNASSPAEGEFPPDYRLVLAYDPDIFLDGNLLNDDCNLANNRIEKSGSKINDLFRSSSN